LEIFGERGQKCHLSTFVNDATLQTFYLAWVEQNSLSMDASAASWLDARAKKCMKLHGKPLVVNLEPQASLSVE
jgi:hypothetical protein